MASIWLSRGGLSSSLVSWPTDKVLQQRLEARTQTELLRFSFEKVLLRSRLESIANIGQTQEPERIPELIFMSYAKADPAGVWDPMVLFGQAFFDQGITEGARKRDIHNAVRMYMPDLAISEPELATSEPVRVNGDARPRRCLLDEIFN